MFKKAWRMRASSPSTSLLVAESMPRMPATNTKSPARTPRLHGPVGLIAPGGDRNSILSDGIRLTLTQSIDARDIIQQAIRAARALAPRRLASLFCAKRGRSSVVEHQLPN